MTPSTVRALDEELADPRLVSDPYPTYARLREEDPVHWCEPWQQWVVTRHDDVLSVVRDPASFSSTGWEQTFLAGLEPEARARLPELERHYSTSVLSNTDPPRHARLRRAVARSFTPRLVEQLRPLVETLVADLLEGLDRPGRVDLVAELCYPLPATVIAHVLGAAARADADFERWSRDLVSFVGTGRAAVERAERANASLAAFRACLEPLLDEARSRPRDDVLSVLAAGDGDEALTGDELVATCVTLLFAGHETTANLLGNGLLALLRNPEQLELLRRDPTLAANAIEELLRFDSPVQRLRRRAVTDVELRGRRIRQGDLVMAFNGAANRDPERFEEPNVLDLRRRDHGHLSFGHGIHFCVGAALSRLEGEVVLDALLRRFPGFRLDPGAPIRWKPNITFRGLESLTVELR